MGKMITDILQTVSFKSAVYFKHGFCAPWGMDTPAGDYAQFHLVTNGNCILSIAAESIQLEKGDIVIFPYGNPHQIKDRTDTFCRSGQEIVAEIAAGITPFPGKKPSSFLICGHFELDRSISHPIFDSLPTYLIIKSSEYGRFDLIYSVFELMLEEMTHKNAGHETVALRLAEILFISIIRHYYINHSTEKLNLFNDELIYEAVDLIHQEIDSDLNIEKLARKVGVSRTLFIERFKKAVGETPMKYVNNWRMTRAKYLLSKTELPVSEIGAQVGYFSETSFNRVFKQKFNTSPGKFRRSLQSAH